MITVEQLTSELRSLKRGPGIGTTDLLAVAGPGLRRLCEFDESQGVEILRSRLSDLIRQHAERLADDPGLAVLAVFGLHPEAQHRFMKERLLWVLGKIDRDAVRTADRLADRGIERIAQSMLAQWAARRSNPRVPTEWYTGRLEVTVRLDLAQPEFRERRVIVARESGLREVAVASMLPKIADPDRAAATAEVSYGGTLTGWSRVAPTVYTGTLRLPGPLPAGARHEYEVVYRTSPPQLVQPIYLVTPVVQCDHLVVRVKFAEPGSELTVWLLDGVYRGIAEDPMAADVPTLKVDGDGWVEASFDDLAIGLTYGVRWQQAS